MLCIRRHCDCCYHVYHGPIWMVIPDGFILVQCCKCGRTKTIHMDHFCQHHGPYIQPITYPTYPTREWKHVGGRIRNGDW